jgi:hypothetical protein
MVKTRYIVTDRYSSGNPKEYRCNICDVGGFRKFGWDRTPPYDNMVGIDEHLLTEHKDACFKCKLCDHLQVDKDMSSHTIKEHKDKCFECDNCNKLFTSKCKLKNHMYYESMIHE